MARSGAAQSAEVIGLMNVISQSGQRERELKQERSFEGMLNQWNQLATAQRRKEEIELTNTMETMRQADIRKDQLKDKISNYGIMLEQSGGEAAASPGFMSVMKDSVGKAEQQYGTLEEQGQQHQAKIAQTMQRIDAINKQSDQANTMNTQFQQGYGDVSTAQWIIQKYGGTAGEGTLDRMRVNQDELRSALEGLPQNKKDVYAPGSASFMGLQKQISELQDTQIKQSLDERGVSAEEARNWIMRERTKAAGKQTDVDERANKLKELDAMYKKYDEAKGGQKVIKVPVFDKKGRPTKDNSGKLVTVEQVQDVGENKGLMGRLSTQIQSMEKELYPNMPGLDQVGVPADVYFKVREKAASGDEQSIELIKKLQDPLELGL